jgi:hypothetical protein
MKKFEVFPPEPIHVDEEFYYKTLEDYTKKGEPVPKDFNWYPGLPDDTVV